jgi:hypothetical protein
MGRFSLPFLQPVDFNSQVSGQGVQRRTPQGTEYGLLLPAHAPPRIPRRFAVRTAFARHITIAKVFECSYSVAT